MRGYYEVKVLDTEIHFFRPFEVDHINIATILKFQVKDNFHIVTDVRFSSPEAVFYFISVTYSRVLLDSSMIAFKTQMFEKLTFAFNKWRNNWEDKYNPYGLYDHVDKKLMKHQVDCIWRATYKRVNLFALEQGTGKTLTAASITKMFNINRTLVISPSLVKWNWLKDLSDEFGFEEHTFTVLDAKKTVKAIIDEKWVIVNYESIPKFKKDIIFQDVGHIIIDECFPYHTPIITDLGILPIGLIVDNKLDCNVLSCDLSNNVLSFEKILYHNEKERKEEYIRINHSLGELVCTRNHKIYVEGSGFKRADEVESGQELRILWKGMGDTLEERKHSKIVFEEMLYRGSEEESRMESKVIGSPSESPSKVRGILSRVWKYIQKNKSIKKEVLRNELLCEVENETAGNKRESIYRRKHKENGGFSEVELHKKSNESQSNFGKNEEEQSNERPEDKREGFESFKRESVSSKKRWKWSYNSSSDKTSRSFWAIIRVCCKNFFNKSFNGKTSESLQVRSSRSSEHDSSRSRWFFSQFFKNKRKRQEENRSFELVRVESVEILKRGSEQQFRNVRGEDKVYNIQVEKNSNYFANGILVSNCHYLKNTTSLRYKNVKMILDHFPKARVTMLTGTPITNRIMDLYSYIKLARVPILSTSKYGFRDKFAKVMGNKVVGVKNVEELRGSLSNFMIRKKTSDCIDLPAVRHKKCYIGDEIKSESKYFEVLEETRLAKERLDELKIEHQRLKELGDVVGAKKIQREMFVEKGKARSNIITLNKLCAISKVPSTIKMIQDLIDEGEKVIIFSQFKEPLHKLKYKFIGKCVYIDGSVPALERQQEIEKFKKDKKIMVYIAQIVAGGIGVNLVNSANVFFLDLPFTSDKIEQAYRRAVRKGQTREVNINYMILKDSIDEKIFGLVKSKAKDISDVIDGGESDMDYSKIEDRLLDDLFGVKQKGFREI